MLYNGGALTKVSCVRPFRLIKWLSREIYMVVGAAMITNYADIALEITDKRISAFVEWISIWTDVKP